jgi:hypothetical protein
VQVDPIKPTLKAPGTKRLKLKRDEPLSKFALKFKLRLYTKEMLQRPLYRFLRDAFTHWPAGAYTLLLLGST